MEEKIGGPQFFFSRTWEALKGQKEGLGEPSPPFVFCGSKWLFLSSLKDHFTVVCLVTTGFE